MTVKLSDNKRQLTLTCDHCSAKLTEQVDNNKVKQALDRLATQARRQGWHPSDDLCPKHR